MPRPLTILAALSLLLSVLLFAAWPLSYWRAVDVRSGRAIASVFRGSIMVGLMPLGPLTPLVEAYAPARIDLAAEHGGRAVLGFGGVSASPGYTLAWCPIWFPAALLLIPPAWWWARRRKGAAGRGFEVETAGTA